ncbi:hypothetical protein FMN50_01430 [Rhodobacterales bacterium]|nr:hypothetical protein FMN50_01430 [Rhodobacterales bacterium]
MPDNISLVNPREVARRFLKLVRGGAPVFFLGLGAVPVYSIVKARAEERNISFSQAAREVGLDLGEEELKSLAADVGVDLAVSLTPVGVLKKAWDVLGNIDDIVALTQLYGEAYPDNQVIQEMAELARTVEGSDAFQAYSYARDALTGAVGGALDRILGTGEDDEETAAAVAELRTSLQDGGAVLQAANSGATQAELAESLSADVRRRMAERRSLFGAETVATADAPLSAPRPDTGLLSPESSPGDGVLREGQRMPLEDVPKLPGSAAILPPEFVREGGAAAGSPAVGAEEGETRALGAAQEGVPVPRPKPGEEPAVPGAGTGNPKVAQRPARKTSYDTYRKLGRTPEEEKAAIADYKAIFRKSYLDVGGDEDLADLVAAERFKLDWGLSEFAPDAEGTVMKHPAEKVYPDLEKDGHSYVRKEVKTLLDKQGVKAAKWYLSPNGKTGSDHGRAPMDETGYGPRMSLIVEDEAGSRMEVTDSFQADMAGARQRFLTARLKKDREEAKRYGIKVPPPGTNGPPVKLAMPTMMSARAQPPVPRTKPESGPRA